MKRERQKLIAAVREQIGFLDIDQLESLLEYIKVLCRPIEFEDMTDEQKRIVEAGLAEPAGTFPQGLTREEMRQWMKERFKL